jgi:two-component sensor histidine kinase
MVLTERSGGGTEAALADLLPAGRDLAGEAGGAPRVFAARDGGGAERVYTVTPLVPGVAYAMGIWSPAQGALAVGPLARAPLLFPLLMWAVSLLVAFVAINRMVIRPVRALGSRMRRFARDRTLPPVPNRDAPRELRDIGAAFRHTAEEILHDEARMEKAFRERGVLLREVHHRVKNNLQLISSIISMQARRSPEPAMRQTLRRLQDRVLTLATIYRQLYTSEDMGDVDAADVLRAVARQETGGRPGGLPAGVVLDLDLQPLAMVPDQVVPLAFLASEALANAVAQAGAGPAHIGVCLRATEVEGAPGARFCIDNDTVRNGEGVRGPGGPEGVRGLGTHLIRAFAAQLGGPPEIEDGGGTYRVSVTFPLHAAPAGDAPEVTAAGPETVPTPS